MRSCARSFDAGALGFASDGTIVVRDASKLALKDRVAVNQAVADDNRDRKAVYREVAVANGHPEWEGQIREVFARQWVDSARPGWWYQSGGGLEAEVSRPSSRVRTVGLRVDGRARSSSAAARRARAAWTPRSRGHLRQ